MRKTIKRKKRIYIENVNDTKIDSYIFLSSKKIENKETNVLTHKFFKINKRYIKKKTIITKLFINKLNDNTNEECIHQFANKDFGEICKTLKIKKKYILEKIVIYNKKNISITIVILDYNMPTILLKETNIIDFYKESNIFNQKNNNYNNIYFYNKNRYKYKTLCGELDNLNIKINMIDIYFYLIGYF